MSIVTPTTSPPHTTPQEARAQRHTRAAAARRGSICADRRIEVIDSPDPRTTVYSADELTAPPATPESRIAARQFVDLPLVIRKTARGGRVRVWRGADGRWWRQGGVVHIRLVDGVRSYVVTLWKGANQDDIRFMLGIVRRTRIGEGFDAWWRQVAAPWADDQTFVCYRSRPYEDPYQHSDPALDVAPCTDASCRRLWHHADDVHEIDTAVVTLPERRGAYDLRVQREFGAEDPWIVSVYISDMFGTPEDVGRLVTDLQWMQAECEKANRTRTAA